MELTKGLVDLHYHSGPDIKPRKLNDLELMEQAVAVGARAVVLKTHFSSTAGRAVLVNHVRRQKYPHAAFEAVGGVALNQSVGGLNPYGLETELKLGAKVVWLPTLDAENERQKTGRPGGVPVVRDGKAVGELEDIFALVREYKACLQTGHLSPRECFVVVEAARRAGVENIVITHPEYHIVGMSLAQQAELVKEFGVLLEREYAQPKNGQFVSNLADNAAAIRAIGPEHFILATDSGQTDAPCWRDAVEESLAYYQKAGLTEAELRTMTQTNPGRMLGLTE